MSWKYSQGARGLLLIEFLGAFGTGDKNSGAYGSTPISISLMSTQVGRATTKYVLVRS